jgi:hypothetical protein
MMGIEDDKDNSRRRKDFFAPLGTPEYNFTQKLTEMITLTVGKQTQPISPEDVENIKKYISSDYYAHEASRALKAFREEIGVIQITHQLSEEARTAINQMLDELNPIQGAFWELKDNKPEDSVEYQKQVDDLIQQTATVIKNNQHAFEVAPGLWNRFKAAVNNLLGSLIGKDNLLSVKKNSFASTDSYNTAKSSITQMESSFFSDKVDKVDVKVTVKNPTTKPK